MFRRKSQRRIAFILLSLAVGMLQIHILFGCCLLHHSHHYAHCGEAPHLLRFDDFSMSFVLDDEEETHCDLTFLPDSPKEWAKILGAAAALDWFGWLPPTFQTEKTFYFDDLTQAANGPPSYLRLGVLLI